MAARLPLRLLGRQIRCQSCRRAFSSSPHPAEAHNFTMPAMSPTMTEGNISSWKVKEGDSFSTGDVLLEIETDKATMDVEAQDDGIMAKIFAQEGSKGVQVGSRIAVLADAGDDISSLEIPPDDAQPVSTPQENVKRAEESASSTESAAPKGSPENPRPARKAPASSPTGPGQNTKYPLYPSVIALIHQHHLSDGDVAKIPATGPNSRLLKGDVLSYLGDIASDYSSKQSERIEHMSHLDLSNIKILPAAEKPKVPTTETHALPELPPATFLSLTISLTEVLKIQKRIHDTLGVSMPLSTFLARAVDIANDDLPPPKGASPSPDALFNAVLGLDTLSTETYRGHYLPQIEALPPPARSTTQSRATAKTTAKKPDIIDILSGHVSSTFKPTSSPSTSSPSTSSPSTSSPRPLPHGATNIFSLTVPRGEEKRARIFLERVKTVLQVEPGKLVL